MKKQARSAIAVSGCLLFCALRCYAFLTPSACPMEVLKLRTCPAIPELVFFASLPLFSASSIRHFENSSVLGSEIHRSAEETASDLFLAGKSREAGGIERAVERMRKESFAVTLDQLHELPFPLLNSTPPESHEPRSSSTENQRCYSSSALLRTSFPVHLLCDPVGRALNGLGMYVYACHCCMENGCEKKKKKNDERTLRFW